VVTGGGRKPAPSLENRGGNLNTNKGKKKREALAPKDVALAQHPFQPLVKEVFRRRLRKRPAKG